MDIAALRHTFASRIRKLREGKLNQGEFADSVGVSRGAMSYYEQESRTPDIGVLRAICEKYHVSADYLLGLIPDQNHSVSDVCLETGLTPETVKRLRIINQLNSTEFLSPEHQFDFFGDDIDAANNLVAYISVRELLNVLIQNDEGLGILNLLGAIILGAELEGGEIEPNMPVIKLKSASKNFHIAIPIQDLTAALWVNIQDDANRLKEKLQDTSTLPE
jgi:transcriptional regulator with XRE-family HTH domain